MTPIALGVRALLPASVELPLHAGDTQDPETAGLIYDDRGTPVAVVDCDRAMADAAAGCIAQALVLALNTVCGLDTASNVAAQ